MIVIFPEELGILNVVPPVVPAQVVLLAHASGRQLSGVWMAFIGVVAFGNGVASAMPVEVRNVGQFAVGKDEEEGQEQEEDGGSAGVAHYYWF